MTSESKSSCLQLHHGISTVCQSLGRGVTCFGGFDWSLISWSTAPPLCWMLPGALFRPQEVVCRHPFPLCIKLDAVSLWYLPRTCHRNTQPESFRATTDRLDRVCSTGPWANLPLSRRSMPESSQRRSLFDPFCSGWKINKKLLVTDASLLVTSALLITRGK